MKLNEERIVEYLNEHVGERMRSIDLVMQANAADDFVNMNKMEMNRVVNDIAKRNGFRLDYYEGDLGLPYLIDFRISREQGNNEAEKKVTELPEDWENRLYDQQVCWFIEHFSTDEDDDEGNLIFDTESMSEEILEAYRNVILAARKARKHGIIYY